MQRLGWFVGMTLLLVVPNFTGLYAKSPSTSTSINPTLEKGVILKTSFEYKTDERSVRTEKRVFLADRDTKWLNLTRPRDGIVLLGRMVGHDATNLEMEFLIINTNKDDAVLATPIIKTPLGQKAMINMDRPSEKITLSLISKSTGPQ